MKKLLLIFLLTISLTGLAEEDYAYSCQVESSGFYDYSNQKRKDLKAAVLHFDIYLEDLEDSNFWLTFWNSPFNDQDDTQFKIIDIDYSDYQNFSASLVSETSIFANISYDNGFLVFSWMNKGSASLGAYFAQCREDMLFYDDYKEFQEEPGIPVLISMCDEKAVEVTESYYDGSDGIEIPIYQELNKDDPICIEAKNHVFEAKGVWRHNSKILPYESFVTEWLSGDNFDEFYKYDVGDDFRESPGKYFGKEIPTLEGIVPSWDINDMVYISVPLDSLDYDRKNESSYQDYLRNLHIEKIRLKNYGVHFKTNEPYPLETYYTKIGEIDQNTCHMLAPNIKGTCIESNIVYLQKYGGGSMGPTTSIGMFGLFNLENGKEYMVPLKYLTEEAALEYSIK